jgi:hypothetical protein
MYTLYLYTFRYPISGLITVRPRLIYRFSSSDFYLRRFDGVRFRRYINALMISDYRFSNSEALIRI